MSFLENDMERRTGTYGSVRYDAQTMSHLREWFKVNKIPNTIDVRDIHSTVIYSRVKLVEEEIASEIDSVALCELGWEFNPKEFKKLGSALVLVLEAPELVNAHRRLLDNGATHSHEEYIPHVTLSYNVDDTFDTDSLVIPSFKFKPTNMFFEPLNTDWMFDLS